MKPSSTKSPLHWLERDAGFRSVAERASRLLALQEDLRRCVPSIEVVAMGLEAETLLVGTAGAAAAAKLRQLEPSIASALRARGWQVARVKFRPRARGAVAAPAPVEPRADIPAAALAGFEAIREQASSETLKQALTDLLKKHRRR
jgi:hypothetical protein